MLFDLLDTSVREECYFEEYNHEYVVDIEDSVYFIDFSIPALKFGIEFYGDYYHANPIKYDETHYFDQFRMTAGDIWQKRQKEN
jgi:hypothetical protein